MQGSDSWSRFSSLVELQSNFLFNPLPAGPGICQVCRGAATVGYDLCFNCNRHSKAAGGTLAQAVVPIAYAIKRQQHAANLARYKWTNPAPRATRSLQALLMMFIRSHARCLTDAAGGRFTHLITVP
ncbi:MAG: hypothetical protein J2P17_25915, partial [Mycobacterium sp.]|nr:hypothetical protein [Mycobacterium sp.]